MYVVSVASQKGGSGKTTLAGHLAVQAESTGDGPVALIDTDPQGSLTSWWNARKTRTPYFALTSTSRLGEVLSRLHEVGVRLVFIDTPSARNGEIDRALRVSDLIVVPSRPSPHDLRAIGHTVRLVRETGKPLVFVINGATPGARIALEAASALSQHGTLARSILHQRTDFAASMTDGRTVMEVAGKSRSCHEVAHLWQYLKDRLKGTHRNTLPPDHGHSQPRWRTMLLERSQPLTRCYREERA